MDGSVAHHYWRLHRCIKHQTEITIMMTTFASKRKQPVKMIVFVWIANQKRTYKCVSLSWITGKSKRETVCLIGWSRNSTILLNGKLNATGGKFPMHIFQFSVHGGPGHQNHFLCLRKYGCRLPISKSKWKAHNTNASVNKEFYDFSPLIFSLINF